MQERSSHHPSEPNLDLPWCGHCELHTDYKVVWGNVTRLDSDSGTYSETVEVRRCRECNEEMHRIKDYKILILVVNLTLSLIWLGLCYCSFYLFKEPRLFFSAFLTYTVLITLAWFLPTKARKRYRHWKKWAETQNFFELPKWYDQKLMEPLLITVMRHDDWRDHASNGLIGNGSHQLPGVQFQSKWICRHVP